MAPSSANKKKSSSPTKRTASAPRRASAVRKPVRNTFLEVLPTNVLRARAIDDRITNANKMSRANLIKYLSLYVPLELNMPGNLQHRIHMRHRKIAEKYGKSYRF